MPTNNVGFVYSNQQTGGSGIAAGGDGYHGGGHGSHGGGGGGSYVSQYITQIRSPSTSVNGWNEEATLTIEPRRRVSDPVESFNIYAWVTRYNMLRITSGHGALMFIS